MLTADLDYALPEALIAQHPLEPRDHARLMVVDRAAGTLTHSRFDAIGNWLRAGDMLVANDTRVLAARLRGRKPGGGKVEALLLRRLDARHWLALIGGRNVRDVVFERGLLAVRAQVIEQRSSGEVVLAFASAIDDVLGELGETPLPPYIHAPLADAERYQTVFARMTGSAAAPTAGLHFTPGLLARLQGGGIGLRFVTLHVGIDTFRPIRASEVEAHDIHSEWCSVSAETAAAINATRQAGGRVVAVGTTSVRALESAGAAIAPGAPLEPFEAMTRLFITPGRPFQVVDAMITNFHLPRSSLLALVGAFMGMRQLREAYQEAIQSQYRFFSFGDAMLIV